MMCNRIDVENRNTVSVIGKKRLLHEHDVAVTESEDSVVLLVGDDATMRQLKRDFLQQVGFHVIEADDGQHAIELFEEFVPDIILLSVSVLGKSAYEICEVIRSMPHGHYLPILMLADPDNLDSVGRSYNVGATDFLLKPVNGEMLRYRLHYLLRSARNFELLQQSKKNNQTLIDGLPDTIVRLTLNGTVVSYKNGEDASLLLSRVDAVGRRLDELLPPHLAAELVKLVVQVVKTGELAYKEFSLSSAKEKAHYEGRMVRANDYEAVCFFRNITQRKAGEEEIRQLAYYDSLTGLPNRSYFYDWVNSRLESTSVERGSLSVFVLELDNFKHINDTLGHAIGDALLKRVTARTNSAVDKVCEQQADCHDDCETLVSRFGSDEFVVVFSSSHKIIPVDYIVEALHREFSHSVVLLGHEIYITAGIGAASFPADAQDLNALLRNADAALSYSKRLGQNRFCVYSKDMNVRSIERLTLENSLRKALDAKEFFLCYQPQVDLKTGHIVGLEALVRWRHKTLGIISPEVFIPIAESTGLIVSIGEWVLSEACQQMKMLLDLGYDLSRMAVNLSTAQFHRSELVCMIKNALNGAQLNASYLELELTETAVMHNAENSISMLYQIREEGMSLSVDDFGTGYSSLSYLKRFPLDELKIDQSFVKDIESDVDDAAITLAIIAMAHSLKLKVIAEGVETHAQLQILKNHGCDEGQGYLFSYPLLADELEAVLKRKSLLP